MNYIYQISIAIMVLFLVSCDPEKEEETPLDFHNGYFIINEGGYTVGNASISFVSADFSTVEQNIFKRVNKRALGDTAQSLYIVDEQAYIVVNASNKIEVVDRYSMASIATIDGDYIKNPRYLVEHNGFAYVSNWGEASNPDDDFISVIDISTNQVVTTIPVGEGPEKLLISNGKLYVALQGGWHQNNKITIIDITSNTVLNTLIVGDVPNAIFQDELGTIWVLCAGSPSYASEETTGSLHKIYNDEVFYTYTFEDNTHPGSLCIQDGDLYVVVEEHIYTAPIDESLPLTEYGDYNGDFRGIMFADSNYFYTIDGGDYTVEGTLNIFDKENLSLIETIPTGIIPNSIVLN